MFLNEYNQGDYAYLEINNSDIEVYKGTPLSFMNFIKKDLKNFKPKEKGFKKKEFDAYVEVELLVELDKYSKFGVHKGDRGIIMEDYAVKDYVLVDFGRLDQNNEYYGDCISVNLKDLKIINKQ